MECLSPSCRIDDCLQFGDSAVGFDLLSKSDVEHWDRPEK